MENAYICLVDDDQDERELFQDAFADLNSGIGLVMFKSGPEAMDYLGKAEFLPYILFLDLNMPKMGGVEVLQEIRKNSRYDAISVIIYSTSSAAKDINDCHQLGSNGYLVKPASYQALKEIIADVLKSHRKNPRL